jgi:acetolactate synthase I/II/III large subunit
MVARVHDVLARAFSEQGTRTVFALMGDGNMHFLGSLIEREGVRAVNVRHENMGLGMADGYARAGDDVGVCSVTYGPGLSNLPLSLLVAGRAHSPIVVFAGDAGAADDYPGSAHHMNQRALVEAAEAVYLEVRSATSVRDDVAEGFRRARGERRPVVVSATSELQQERAELEPRAQTEDGSPPEVAAAADDAIGAAADLLAAAERPLILAGAGTDATARGLLEELAEITGAALMTTIAAKGAFAGNSRSVGMSGSYMHRSGAAQAAAADLVLAAGARLDPYVTNRGHLFAHARVVTLNRDPEVNVAGVREPDLRLTGDAAATLAKLIPAVESRRSAPPRPAPEPYDFASDDLAGFPYEPEPGTLDPRALMQQVADEIPETGLVVVGAGHFCIFPIRYLPPKRTHRYLPVFDFGTIGQGLPVAIGASVAGGSRPLVAFEGDASLLMNIQELDTIARERLPILLFAMNDGALGAEYHRLERIGFSRDLAAYERADFRRIGEAFGLRASTAETVDQALDAAAQFTRSPEPTLVDVRCSRRVIAPYYR